MSKGLNSLSEMVIHLNSNYGKTRQALEDFRNIEKELKALEIIKEKNVDIWCLKTTKNYDDYLHSPAPTNIVDENGVYHEEQLLTQEEYDLLKEVLKDD